MSYRLQGAPKKRKDLCPLCSVEAEDVSHFILRCPEFATERDRFLSNASVYMSNNELSTDASRLNVILNLRCPPECIPLCCEYVNTIYKKRECSFIWVDYDFSDHHIYCMWIIILLKGVDKSYFAWDPIYSRAMSLHIPCITFMYVCVSLFLFLCHW